MSGGETSPTLAERLLAGDELALARAISVVEDEAPGFEALLHAVDKRVGGARRIGITGPPGAGKSTLTAGLARAYLDRGLRVGVIAVDPTSTFTGGALLGDRIRMTELATVPGVFIRSMASRGSVGGLAASTREAADLMDAFGMECILLETVGVGQSELEVVASADTTVVVLVPESGNGIQALKAGLMEVADLFVVNKADRPGAERLENEIRVMLTIRRGAAWRGIPPHSGEADHHHRSPRRAVPLAKGSGPEAEGAGAAPTEWRPPVLRTVASTADGLEALVAALERHLAFLEQSGELGRRRERARLERARGALLRRLAQVGSRVWEARRGELESRLASGQLSPYEAADEMWSLLGVGDSAEA
ncbi:MAG: methylmalonyl Co-A mutase-associated GTPase MeaB [Gemmatimonadota bacterium]